MEDAGAGRAAAVLLYWLPLGAGGHVVRINGRLHEAFTARRERRPARDLYHSALEVYLGPEAFQLVCEGLRLGTGDDDSPSG